jgi:hypothetical protein
MNSALYRAHWVDTNKGEMQSDERIVADRPLRLQAKTNVLWLEPISTK